MVRSSVKSKISIETRPNVLRTNQSQILIFLFQKGHWKTVFNANISYKKQQLKDLCSKELLNTGEKIVGGKSEAA